MDFCCWPPLHVTLTFLVIMLLCVTCIRTVQTKDLLRLNYGVVLRAEGSISPSASVWYHHFVVDLPDIKDIINTNCSRYLEGKLRSDINQQCPPYISKGPLASLLKDMNQEIEHKLKETARVARKSIPALPQKFSQETQAASLPFFRSHITQNELKTITNRVKEILSKENNLGTTFVHDEYDMESYMKISNPRYQTLKSVVTDNLKATHQAIIHEHVLFNNATNFTSSVVSGMTVNYTNSIISAINILDRTKDFVRHLQDIDNGIADLMRGYLPQIFVSNSQMKRTLAKISSRIANKYPRFKILSKDLNHFHQHRSVIVHLNKGKELWITLKLLVGPVISNNQLYKILVYPVPIKAGSTHATQLMDLPEYVVRAGNNTGDEYAMMTEREVQKCEGDHHKVCLFNVVFNRMAESSCISALIEDTTADIHQICDIRYFHNRLAPGIRLISDSLVLVYDIKYFHLSCKDKRIYETGCKFCTITIPCGCALEHGKFRVTAAAPQSCRGLDYGVTKQHLVNLAVVNELLSGATADMTTSNIFIKPNNDSLPRFGFSSEDMLNFLDDDNKGNMQLKEIMKKSLNQEQVPESPIKPLSWPDINGILILVTDIILIITAIMVICTVVKVRGILAVLVQRGMTASTNDDVPQDISLGLQQNTETTTTLTLTE